MTEGLPKDPMILFRNVREETTKKGANRVQLYLDQEYALKLAATLTEMAKESELGVKLDLFIVDRTTKQGNRTFRSAFAYLKETQESQQGFNRGGSSGVGNVKAKKSVAELEKEIESLRAKVIE